MDTLPTPRDIAERPRVLSTPTASGSGADRPLARVDTLRLFLALWPGPRTRAALAACRDGWHWPPGARPVATDRLHLTLHFIGAVPRPRLPALVEGLQLPCPRFALEFGHAELWPRGTAVLRPLDEPPALPELHARLGAALRRLELPVEARAFRPHVTLARRAAGARPGPPPPRLRWPVQSYALVQSLPGPPGGYRVLCRYAAALRA